MNHIHLDHVQIKQIMQYFSGVLFMKIKKIALTLITIGYTFISPSLLFAAAPYAGSPFGGPSAGGPSVGGAPFNPGMSEEEMLNKLMEEINAAIPEDQRDNFWKEVEAETQRLEAATANMSEEEKQAYLINQMNSAMEEAEQIPIPEPVKEEKKKEEKPKPAPVKEAIETGEILKSIVTSINTFLNKAAAFPDFDRKVSNWAKQNLLSDWSADQTWEQFKNELNKFNSLLQRFQEKDAKIGMKHIDALAKNEQALQSLKELEAKLAREVPIIDVSVFAITSMSKKTKNAIAHTVNTLTQSVYKIKLGETLQKIIEEFDPAAKKLREAEEKAAKAALAQTQRAPTSVQVKTAGKAPKSGGFNLPSLDDAGISGYRGDSGYSGGSGYGRGDYDGSEGFGSDKAKGGSSGGSSSKGGTTSGADAKKTDDKTDAKKPSPTPEPVTAIKTQEVKEHVDNFKKAYGEAHGMIIPLMDKL